MPKEVLFLKSVSVGRKPYSIGEVVPADSIHPDALRRLIKRGSAQITGGEVWPLSTSPKTYLKRHPHGKYAQLAESILRGGA